MVKVIHSKNDCIGCGACAAICPDFWEMHGDKSSLKKSKETEGKYTLELNDSKEIECNKQAESSCPVSCIKIEE
jgi:ferredoxin